MIGKFHEDGSAYVGCIYSAGLQLPSVTISPVPAKVGNGPDFVVIADEETDEFEVGAAWQKTSKENKPYLSVKLDGPMLVAPINCVLLQQQNGSYGLIWTRKDKEHNVADEQAAA